MNTNLINFKDRITFEKDNTTQSVYNVEFIDIKMHKVRDLTAVAW